MKKIIVACGGAVATSTVAADAIRDLCKNNGIQADVVQMRVIEIANNLNGVDLVVTTMRIKPDFDVPYVNGMAFLTGINKEATEEKYKSFFDDFYNNTYKNFIESSVIVAPYGKNALKQKCITLDVCIRVNQLRAYLENNGIIRKFGF